MQLEEEAGGTEREGRRTGCLSGAERKNKCSMAYRREQTASRCAEVGAASLLAVEVGGERRLGCAIVKHAIPFLAEFSRTDLQPGVPLDSRITRCSNDWTSCERQQAGSVAQHFKSLSRVGSWHSDPTLQCLSLPVRSTLPAAKSALTLQPPLSLRRRQRPAETVLGHCQA